MTQPTDSTQEGEKQCRICLDGTEAEQELGKLIRPCLCKGSISFVHLKCLHRWRVTSASQSAFFACPQCHYKYRFARTKVVGIATNPVVVGGISGLVFTLVVMLASFVTTFFMSGWDNPATVYYISIFHVSPIEIVRDIARATLRIVQDGGDLLEDTSPTDAVSQAPAGFFRRFVRRFILGLPIVGAGSLVHMLLTVPVLGPVHWLARYRGNRRRDNSKDIAALIIVVLVIIGALRALYQVYQLTQAFTKRLLTRAEDAILEVA